MIHGIKGILSFIHVTYGIRFSRVRMWMLIRGEDSLYPRFPVELIPGGHRYCADESRIATWWQECQRIAKESVVVPRRRPARSKKSVARRKR